MKKISTLVLAVALTLAAASGFAAGKAKGVPEACREMKGKERAACIKSERAKRMEARKAAKPAAKSAAKPEGTEAKAPAGAPEGSK